MRLRPTAAHWFETYVPRNETVHALEAFAATGVVQLELDPRLAEPLDLDPVHRLIDRFQVVKAKYSDLLPAPDRAPGGLVEAPEATARKALDCLETWSAAVDILLGRQVQLETRHQNLLLLDEYLTAIEEAIPDAAQVSRKSGILYKGVFACPRTQLLAAEICATIDEFIPGHEHNFFIVADEPGCRDIIEEAYRSQACLSLQIPDWLASSPEEQQSQIKARIAEIEAQAGEIQESLEEKKKDRAIIAALADIDLLVWYLNHTTHLASAQTLCHVTGWTMADNAEFLQQAFRRADIHGAIRFATSPEFSRAPVHMRQPWWARPFLFILEMLGTTDSTEIDSGKLLPIIVPLLFGYMFPDIGHGLMLVLLSAMLYRRWPAGRFLIPCGLSAMLFGLVFGEVFGLESVLDPLWITPLEHPLEVLLAPLAFGAGLILLGLVFNGAQEVWRGAARNWLLREAALPVLYASVLTGIFLPQALWGAAFAMLWFLLGQLYDASTGRLAHFWQDLGLLLQNILELALHTLSFLRVGAFALAHAALSTAVLRMTDGIANEFLHILLLVLGHLFIVSLEGLVVFVQTTRLVLFEFFTHFLRAEGRMFLPMSKPPRMQNRRKR
jgi:V/A-type H+-transporting ATPase subunit I